MNTIMDYLDWRGDLSFEVSPFNDIDALILSYFVYTELEELNIKDRISIEEASILFFKTKNKEDILKKKSMTKMAPFLLEKMSKTNRFKNLMIHNIFFYINEEIETQFMALCIDINENTLFISYRGTDETIVGWKEDFNMTFLEETPGQKNSINYLNNLNLENKKIYIGGHSKGGNLALYAIVHSLEKIRNKLIKAYNFDGPGLSIEILKSKNYMEVKDKTLLVVTNNSIIGRLFEYEGNIKIIDSNAKLLHEYHDSLLWKVLGTNFVELNEFTEQSTLLITSIKETLKEIDLNQRKEVINAIFKIIDDCNIKIVDDFTNISLQTIFDAVKSNNLIPQETKSMFWLIVRKYIEVNTQLKKELKNRA